MAGADTTRKESTSKPGDAGPVNADEEPLNRTEIADEDSGGVAGQGGMRSQTKTSDDGKFTPS